VTSRDPFNIIGSDQWLGSVEVIFGDVAPGAAKVLAKYGDNGITLFIPTAPFRIQDLSVADTELVHEKWRKLTGINEFAELSAGSLIQKVL
jgi:hypothetical protein